MIGVPFEAWASRLDDAIGRCAMFTRAHLVHDVGSTQDEARAVDAVPGTIVVAWRQHRGRGRLGREWIDTGDAGVAMTAVLPRGESTRLAIAGGLAAREACALTIARSTTVEGDAVTRTGSASPRPGIKWPNDVLVEQRKLAGVLVEQDDRTALMGIGINVAQRVWPDSIADRATSLAQLGRTVDRIDVVVALVAAMDRALGCSDAALGVEFAAHDALRGTRGRFRCGDAIVEGVVREIDPFRHIRVQRDDGTTALLPVELTSIV